MRLVTHPLRRYPLAAFTVLACLIGWAFYIAAALGAALPPENLPLAPILAAFLVAAAVGRPELRAWAGQLATLRAAPRWYAVAVLAPVAIMAGAVLANTALGAPAPTPEQLGAWPALLGELVGILILIGIGEEAGWTAYLAPRLLDRKGFLVAWLLLAVVRVLWHLPLMLTGDLPWVLGVVGNGAFQFLLLWIFVRSGRVWFLAAVWHTLLNTVGGSFTFQMVEGADRARLGLLMSAGYVLLALAVFLADRRRLPGPGAAGAVPDDGPARGGTNQAPTG